MNEHLASSAVTQTLTLQCLDPAGREVALAARFEYDAADPWAVRIVFAGRRRAVRWLVARDLLLQGLTDPAGVGDATIWPGIDEEGRASVVMELSSPAGRLVAQLRSHELSRFLTRTLAVVPLGSESVDLDHLVAELIGRSQPQ